MKVYNGKALDSYCFDTIIVRDSKKRIDVKGKCNYPTIEVGIPFSKRIKGKEDTFQVNALIDYYLDCTRLDVISDTFYFSHYNERFFACQGNGRLLALHIPSIKEYKGISKKIYDNFSLNRDIFLDEDPNDKYRIVITDGVGKYYNDNGQVSMRLIGMGGRLIPPEEEFLVKFMHKKIDDGGGLAYSLIIDESDRFGLNKRYNVLIKNGTVITFSDINALHVVQGVLNDYNSKEDKNVKVLKLEGF